MAKTQKEIDELRGKVEEVRKELSGLSEEELEKVSGGFAWIPIIIQNGAATCDSLMTGETRENK